MIGREVNTGTCAVREWAIRSVMLITEIALRKTRSGNATTAVERIGFEDTHVKTQKNISRTRLLLTEHLIPGFRMARRETAELQRLKVDSLGKLFSPTSGRTLRGSFRLTVGWRGSLEHHKLLKSITRSSPECGLPSQASK